MRGVRALGPPSCSFRRAGSVSDPPHLRPAGSRNTCCPPDWLEFEGSCYWFSRSGKTWAEADRYCQLESAHLVVINSREEQVRLRPSRGAGGSLGPAAVLLASNQSRSPEADLWQSPGTFMVKQPLIVRGGTV